MDPTEELVKELIAELPKGFIPRPEKLLIFSGGMNKAEARDIFTKETVHYVALIAKARGIPLDYFFTSTLRSNLLEEDLHGMKRADLITWGSPITPTKKGWLVIDTFTRQSPTAKTMFESTVEFARDLKRQVHAFDWEDTLEALINLATKSLYDLMAR